MEPSVPPSGGRNDPHHPRLHHRNRPVGGVLLATAMRRAEFEAIKPPRPDVAVNATRIAVRDEIARFPRSHIGLCRALALPLPVVEEAVRALIELRQVIDRGWTFAIRDPRLRRPTQRAKRK